MKVYLAAPWVERDLARIEAQKFIDSGYEITEAWWDHEQTTDPTELEKQALRDVMGVVAADIFVLLNSGKSEGKAVEMGMAMVLDKPVLIIGEPSNIFHYLTDFVEVVASVDEGLTRIKEALGD